MQAHNSNTLLQHEFMVCCPGAGGPKIHACGCREIIIHGPSDPNWDLWCLECFFLEQ